MQYLTVQTRSATPAQEATLKEQLRTLFGNGIGS